MVVEAWDAHTLPCRMSLNIFSRSARHVYLRTCRHFPPFFWSLFCFFSLLEPMWTSFEKKIYLLGTQMRKRLTQKLSFISETSSCSYFIILYKSIFFCCTIKILCLFMHECPLTIKSFLKTVDTFVTNFRGVVNHICRSRSEWVKKCYLWSPLQKQRRELYK